MNHLKIKITEQQKANLLKLADYLEQPKLKAEFDMYRYSSSKEYWIKVRETSCKSVGCAIGHGPYARIPKIVGEDWREYCSRVFTDSSDAFLFMFDCLWSNVDNTAKGASERIKYFLKNGVPIINKENHTIEETLAAWCIFIKSSKN